MEIKYITTKPLQNSEGKGTGRIRIIVLKGEDEAHVDYVCPQCGFSEKKNEPWKKPFRMKCTRCNFLIKISSLRAEIKRERKVDR